MIDRAFVLGAGLGLRLRPLTERVPKPLIPIVQKPLVSFALDHLLDAGVRRLAVNTHHGASLWAEFFPGARYAGVPLVFRHEPLLLETGGGIKNVEDVFGDAPFLVYNGDVLADLPLALLAARHLETGDIATLALRSSGGPRRVAFDPGAGAVLDLAGLLGTRHAHTHVFTGLYALSPAIFSRLEAGRAESVVHAFLRMIARGERVGAIVIDEGHWHDLGTVDAYRGIHRWLADAPCFPSFPARPHPAGGPDWRTPVHPDAAVSGSARIEGRTTVGAGARVGRDVLLRDCIVWPGAQIACGARLRGCIVTGRERVEGAFDDRIL